MEWWEAGPSAHSSVRNVTWCICFLQQPQCTVDRVSVWPGNSPLLDLCTRMIKNKIQTIISCVVMGTAFLTAHRGNNPNFYQLTNKKGWCIRCRGILLSSRREQTTDRCCYVSEPCKHLTKWKKPDIKCHTVYNSIYTRYPQMANFWET